MKIKLDENVDYRIVSRLQMAGHDVATASGQGLNSAPDPEVIKVCQQEGRCLISADRDFSNRTRFPPADYAGIVVIRLPKLINLTVWCEAIDTLILGFEQSDVTGKLWVVRGNIIQKYQPLETEDEA